jgi:hypothetical protein
LKRAVTDAEQSELADLLKDDIWFYQEALKEYERRVSAQSVRKLFADAQPLFDLTARVSPVWRSCAIRAILSVEPSIPCDIVREAA